jgi:hypothetical protein
VDLFASVKAGRVRAPPRGSKVPRWLRRAVERGFAGQADERWPSLTDLLGALVSGRARTRRLWVLGVTGAVVFATAGWLSGRSLHRRDVADACAREGAAVDEVWNEGVAERVHGVFEATGVAYAERSYQGAVMWTER